jgi:hypothetical protein
MSDHQMAQNVEVHNSGGFYLSFNVWWQDGSGAKPHTDQSGTFPLGQSGSIDVHNQHNIPGENWYIRPSVSVVAGAVVDGEAVQYSLNGRTAHYTVTGTIWNVHVEFDGIK